MKLQDLRASWDTFGEQNAMWAVLTSQTDWEPDQFFATGVAEIDTLLHEIDAVYPGLQRERALDFGCGVGRLSQALAAQFEHVDGVDIAASMIAQAREFNRFDSRCTYHLNTRDDLQLFESNAFDLVYTNIVLQHMEPRYARSYIREFYRIVRPGGLVVFQIPSELRGGNALRKAARKILPVSAIVQYRKVRDSLLRRPSGARMEMYGIPRPDICRLLNSLGATIVKVEQDTSETTLDDWEFYRYFAAKPTGRAS